MANKYAAKAKKKEVEQDALLSEPPKVEEPDSPKEEPTATVEPVAEESPKVKQPKKVSDKDKPGSQRGLPDGWTRFTVTVPIEMAEDLKDLAYTERLKLKDVVVRAFEEALKGKDLIRRPDRKD